MDEQHRKIDEIERLMAEYRNDQKWLKEAMKEQGDKIDGLVDRLSTINQTIHNGLKERQKDISERLTQVESALGGVVTKTDLDDHKQNDEKLHNERWQGQNRRQDDKYKTVAMVVSIATAILSFASVVAVFLRLGTIL